MQVLLLVFYKTLVSTVDCHNSEPLVRSSSLVRPLTRQRLNESERRSRSVGAKSPLPQISESVEESTEIRATIQLEPTGATVPSSTASDTAYASAARVLPTTRLIVLLVQKTKCPSWKFSLRARNAGIHPSEVRWQKRHFSKCHQLGRGHISITPRGYLKVVSEDRWALRATALRARASAIVGGLERCAARFTFI